MTPDEIRAVLRRSVDKEVFLDLQGGESAHVKVVVFAEKEDGDGIVADVISAVHRKFDPDTKYYFEIRDIVRASLMSNLL